MKIFTFCYQVTFAKDTLILSSIPETCFSPHFQPSPNLPEFHTIPDSPGTLSFNASISLWKPRNCAITIC